MHDEDVEARADGEVRRDLRPDFTQSDAEERRATQRRQRGIEADAEPGPLCEALRSSASLCVKLSNRQEAGTTSIRVTWRVVELWKLPAADLLDAGDVGLLPPVPLADFDGPLEPILEECRDRIEREAAEDEREDPQVVTRILAGLK